MLQSDKDSLLRPALLSVPNGRVRFFRTALIDERLARLTGF